MTRDPNLVITALLRAEKTMTAHDLRVGQYIDNALAHVSIKDAFYVEDDVLARAIDNYTRYLNRRK